MKDHLGLAGSWSIAPNYLCSHHVQIDTERWSDDLPLSDLEPPFVCQSCGRRVRPLFESAPKGTERYMPWDVEFDPPVPGFKTLREAAEYMMKLPASERQELH